MILLQILDEGSITDSQGMLRVTFVLVKLVTQPFFPTRS